MATRIVRFVALVWALFGALYWGHAFSQPRFRTMTAGDQALMLTIMMVIWPVALYRELHPAPTGPATQLI
jgi:hypothetical protein